MILGPKRPTWDVKGLIDRAPNDRCVHSMQCLAYTVTLQVIMANYDRTTAEDPKIVETMWILLQHRFPWFTLDCSVSKKEHKWILQKRNMVYCIHLGLSFSPVENDTFHLENHMQSIMQPNSIRQLPHFFLSNSEFKISNPSISYVDEWYNGSSTK